MGAWRPTHWTTGEFLSKYVILAEVLSLKNLHSFALYSVVFHDGEHGAEKVRLEQPRELRCYQSGVLRHWRAHSHRLSPGQARCLGASMLVAGSQMWQEKGWEGRTDPRKEGGGRCGRWDGLTFPITLASTECCQFFEGAAILANTDSCLPVNTLDYWQDKLFATYIFLLSAISERLLSQQEWEIICLKNISSWNFQE